MSHVLPALAFAALAAFLCDVTMENPGGSRAGADYTFTVSSNAVPITVTVSAGGESVWTGKAELQQNTLTVKIPDSARGKTLEIVAENKDGCLVSWTETVQ